MHIADRLHKLICAHCRLNNGTCVTYAHTIVTQCDIILTEQTTG